MKEDISKSLFLDLAFIIIAALVLLVKDPELVLIEEEPEAEQTLTVRALQVEQGSSEVYEDVNLPGESLFLRIGTGGAEVLLAEDERDAIQLTALPERLEGMAPDGPRVVVMQMDEAANYQTYANWRNRLLELKQQGLIHQIHEL
jgi:biopolymer transport protein ExbD